MWCSRRGSLKQSRAADDVHGMLNTGANTAYTSGHSLPTRTIAVQLSSSRKRTPALRGMLEAAHREDEQRRASELRAELRPRWREVGATGKHRGGVQLT
jgi:hypothetical protein